MKTLKLANAFSVTQIERLPKIPIVCGTEDVRE